MIVGSLGKIIFGCSSFYIKTINDFSGDKSVKWVEHEVISGKPKLQFEGVALDDLKLNIHLNAAWNVNPTAAAKEFEEYMKVGKKLRFILGSRVIGNGWFVITSMSETYKAYTSLGNVSKMELSLQLKEYN